jgi:hypothetical protein
MASTHIYPSTTTRLAGQLNALIVDMQRVHSDAEKLKLIFDQIAADSDFTSLATELGYATAADAETAYNLLGSALTDDINGAFFQQMISRMG